MPKKTSHTPSAAQASKFGGLSLAKLSVALLFTVACILFFALRYPHHLHYQEQYQLFQFTGAYFWNVVTVPGGLADWIGRCLTQFFYFAWCGATMVGVLLTLIALALWLSIRRRRNSGLFFVLSFVPALLSGLFLCDENALLGAPVALWLSLSAAAGVQAMASGKCRYITTCLAVPVLYMLLGPLSVVTPLLVVLHEGIRSKKQAALWLAGFALLATLTLAVARQLFPYPWKSLCLGVHYFRIRDVFSLWIGLAAGASLLVYAFAVYLPGSKGKRPLLAGMIAFLLLAAAAWGGIRLCCDFSKEESMKYDYMTRMHMWNRTMLTADKKQPSNPLTVTCLNLALAKSGRMADALFDYYQNGPEGLLPAFQRDFTSPLPTAEAYYQLGMINTAQRYTFEAQEAIPDYQKSARCYKRLAETNIINGDYEVARKYLLPLTHTLYYRKWARQTLVLLDEPSAIDGHPEYGALRRMRLHYHDFMFSSGETDSMLGLLFTENPSNTLARDYLMSWCLLNKNLKRFEECLQLVQGLQMPRSYQEAYLLLWVQTHSSFDGLPAFIDNSNVQRISAFMQDSRQKVDTPVMRQRYGNTYWYYYIYRYNPAE